jgi:predicted glycosyltransferase
MKILFHLGHPAHFHLFKIVIGNLKNSGHQVFILIKKKDVLEELLEQEHMDYFNILPEGRKDSKIGLAVGQIKQDVRMWKFVKKHKPDLLVGTSVAITHVGKLMGIPSINVNEDDAHIVPFYSKMAYPFASVIVSPDPCNNGKWEHKSVHYNGYHELAYLHPNHFQPDREIADQYISTNNPYYILRFAKLGAHHDKGIKGINNEIALEIIELLKSHGRILITSERELIPELEQYRIAINPIHMHHIMAFASLYIGDSQTMAAEAGVLGTPFIRFNDFVDRIGYLNELENKYKLGAGFRSDEVDRLLKAVNEMAQNQQLRDAYKFRRLEMLEDKMDVAQFLTWFIGQYPESEKVM